MSNGRSGPDHREDTAQASDRRVFVRQIWFSKLPVGALRFDVGKRRYLLNVRWTILAGSSEGYQQICALRPGSKSSGIGLSATADYVYPVIAAIDSFP